MFYVEFHEFTYDFGLRHDDNPNRRNPFGNQELNNSQQPGAGESKNTSSPPFHAQGSQPPRVGHARKTRVPQNRYAVPSTMHYSESSQAEAGQQIDRLRQTNQPVPSALINENPEVASNPSNSQNVPPINNEGGNDPMVMASGNNEDFLQQFANGQQDSAQPGVPATNNPPNNDEDENQDSENEHAMGNHDDDPQRDEVVEEDKEEELGQTEKEKFYEDYENSDSDRKQEKNKLENANRPNHQEENFYDFKDDPPYENKAIRQNEQFSPAEKNLPGLEKIKKFNAGSRKPSNGPSGGQPFGYNIGQQKSGNYATFVVPSSFTDSPPYMSQNTREGSQYSSSYVKDR